MNLKLNTFMKNGLLLLVAMMLGSFVYAQRTVKGKITDSSNGDALIGANVTSNGTAAVTDIDGMYSINVPAGASAITVSYTGFDSQTITLGSSNVVDIALRAGTLLNDVVVVGYGTVKKSDATGAVVAVGEKDFNKGVISSPEQLLQGRAAGVQISNNNGEPGGGISVRVRGTSSVFGANNPLFVIDGVPLTGDAVSGGFDNIAGLGRQAAKNPLNFMNPNDIEKIDVLKDASATAIYGSRGANGVILITTKKGKGKGSLDYGYSIGQSSITKKYDLLDAAAFKTAGGLDNGAVTDWQDQILRKANTQQHNLSYGGGDDKGSYRFSLGYMNQDGIVKNTNLTRYSAGLNANRKFIDNRLDVGMSLNMANIKDQGAPISENVGFNGDLLGNMLKMNPTTPVFVPKKDSINPIDKSTVNYWQLGVDEPNPVAMLAYSKDVTNSLRALGNFNAELQIVDGLKFKTVYGFDQSFSSRRVAQSKRLRMYGSNARKTSEYALGEGRVYGADIQNDNKLWENYFTYDKTMGSIALNALAGYSYQSFGVSSTGFSAANFPYYDMDLMINNVASATPYKVKNPDDKEEQLTQAYIVNSANTTDELQSYFGRVNLGIKNKYNLTATVRRDGSSRFGANNKYGIFPSFAAKWKLIEEDFIPKNIFSDLGLRVGYGITGNQSIPHNRFDSRRRYANKSYGDYANALNGGAFDNVSFANPDLKWESTKSTSLGLDFGIMKGRITGSLDLYKKNTSDLLFNVVSPQPAPTPFQWRNLNADIENKGIELSLNIFAVDTKDFTWQVQFNGALNKNMVKSLDGVYDTGEISGQGLTGAFAERLAEGQPLYAFFVRPFTGFDDKGISKYSGDYQQFLGQSPLPKFTGGLTNTFAYKGLDASFFLNIVRGNWIYNNTENAYFTKGSLNNSRNVTSNVVALTEGALNAPDVSDRFLHKGDFVRLANVNLGYNWKAGFAGISNIRFYVTGQNLFTFTKYDGQDPEVSTNKSINGIPSFGIDYVAYPRAKTIIGGINVSF
jgi:TonB-dependent starch-binding outer membrane protein SusC